MTPALGALGLACVKRIADARTAAIASQSSIKLCYAPITIGTVQPRPFAAKETSRPRNSDLLRYLIDNDLKHPSINENLLNRRKFQGRKHSPAGVSQKSSPMKLPHVEAIIGQSLDR